MINSSSFKTTLMNPFGVMIEPTQNQQDLKDINIADLKDLFKEHQLILLRGFDALSSSENFSKYCAKWGQISVWPFGDILEIKEQENAKDHIFDSNYVPLHWDGMYRPQIAEYQIFRALEAPLKGKGGRTTFSNTKLVLESASKSEKELWSKVSGTYERKMEFYSSKTSSPIISKHPYHDYSVIRYNEPPVEDSKFLNPPTLEFSGLTPKELEEFHQSLQNALHTSANYYAHEWQTNDIVIADNHTLLHGREAFEAHSPRRLQRIHVLGQNPFENPGLIYHK